MTSAERSTDLVAMVSQALSSEGIEGVEAKMLACPQVECSVAHHFGPGVYVREVRIPAGSFAIGHYQRFAHMNYMVKGRVIMLNPDGTTTDMRAPVMFTGQPGRKIGYIVEDMVWHNIYPTHETDIDVLESTYLIKSDTWMHDNALQHQVDVLKREADREDYRQVLAEFGFTEAVARAQSENESDQIPMPERCRPFRIADSPIDGEGFYVTAPVRADEVIAPARIRGMRTPAGRFVNHSIKPNATMKRGIDGDIYLVALSDLQGCLGGSVGEEVTIDYRASLRLVMEGVCLP